MAIAHEGLYEGTVQTGIMLSVRWWSYEVDGGLPEIMILRCVVKGLSWTVIARANGCHLPSDDDSLAKMQMGFVCFDAAIERSARLLKSSWAVCGGYALSRLMRARAPHDKYQFVERLHRDPLLGLNAVVDASADSDLTWSWGDVDFFLTSEAQDWGQTALRKAGKEAIRTVKQSLSKVAACDHFEDSARAYNDAGYPRITTTSDPTTDSDDELNLPSPRRAGHLVIRDIKPLGLMDQRSSSIQFIMNSRSKGSALKQVLAFDMTQCCIWIDDVTRDRTGQYQVKLAMPCEAWLQATLERKGSCIRKPFLPMPLRLIKYNLRGFVITVHCDELRCELKKVWKASRSLNPPKEPCAYTYVNLL